MPHDYSREINAAFAAYEATRAKIVDLPLIRFECGPYYPPAVQIGDMVECARFGVVRVIAWSEGPLPWPLCSTGGTRSLILFEDLERAVRAESRLAVALAWGVSKPTITEWRRHLEVGHNNAGSRARHRAIVSRVITPTQNAEGLERAHSLDVRLQIEERRRAGAPPSSRWTPDVVDLMGVETDVEIASRVGCHAVIVGIERRRRGIRTAARNRGRDLVLLDGRKVQGRRHALGLTQSALALRYGCTRDHICRYENRRPLLVAPTTLNKFARALGCQPADLLAETDDFP